MTPPSPLRRTAPTHLPRNAQYTLPSHVSALTSCPLLCAWCLPRSYQGTKPSATIHSGQTIVVEMLTHQVTG